MRQIVNCVLWALVLVITLSAGSGMAKPGDDKKTAKPCVEKIHIIYGCHTCEAMMAWLKAGGVELDVKDIQTGPYKLYPTVIYSDKTNDNGENMYKHQASIPGKVCIVRCNVGME